jgi:hypothetical protein
MAVSNAHLTIPVDIFANVAAALLKRAAHRDDSMEQGNWR